jgi:hypothetical protein
VEELGIEAELDASRALPSATIALLNATGPQRQPGRSLERAGHAEIDRADETAAAPVRTRRAAPQPAF